MWCAHTKGLLKKDQILDFQKKELDKTGNHYGMQTKPDSET